MEYKTPEDRVHEDNRKHLRSMKQLTIALAVGLLGVGLGFLADRLNSAPLVIIAVPLVIGAWVFVMAGILMGWGRFARNLFRRYED